MPIRKERTMSRKDDKPKNHSYDVENIEYNFAISVLSLVLTLILSLPALLTFLASNEFPNGIFGFLVGVVVYFVLFVLSLFTTVTAFIGFLLGHSSIKGFETKRKRTWAIIVTSVNFATLIGSIVGVVHFSWIFR